MNVLVLGGTSEGLALARALDANVRDDARDARDVVVISSLAGRTSAPIVPPGNVRIGGFGGAAGLARYLADEAIVVNVLVLGGTSEGLALARAIDADGRDNARDEADIVVISSLAGRTTAPIVPPGNVRIGGFGGPSGLASYLADEAIDAVIDATHPFATRISENARLACASAGRPLLVLERPEWDDDDTARTERVADLALAARRARELGTRIFLTIGRQGLAAFAPIDDRWFLIRSIEAPQPPLPPSHALVLARGPFSVADERALMRAHAIDVLVTKASGGAATAAKLEAARDLGIAVVIVSRPRVDSGERVGSVAEALAWIARLGESRSAQRSAAG